MKSICIFCGSNPGARTAYREAAVHVGTILAQRGIQVVYGGGNVGLMGMVADAALAAGGRVFGVIPEGLARLEVAHRAITELHIVGSMHERKQMMADNSDAFIALPGGIGTAEEIFEVFTWSQLGIHLKPCALLNIEGFYDGFVSQIERMVVDGFLREAQAEQLIIEDSVEKLLVRIANVKPQSLPKWTERDKVVV